MKTYPLNSISLEKAKDFQFRMVDAITRHFQGHESLTRGDLGVVPGLNKPITTLKAEESIADFFNTEAALLVRGSGTGAIRYALYSAARPGSKILVHEAPIYNTTETSLKMLGLVPVRADYNDLEKIKTVLQENPDIESALVQYTRQVPEDSYEIEKVIKTIKTCKDIPVITDDNYAVMKVAKTGVELGADLSCFSTFKLQGPEGIGCIIGKKDLIQRISKELYSGGCQTQGWEALEVLRGLVNAPVSLAIQAETNEELVHKVKSLKHINNVFLANAQSKVLIVEFDIPIAKDVLREAEKLGALPNPVGAESKYEIAPMFYRVSGTFRKEDPSREDTMIRINPNRSGSNTVFRILERAIESVQSCS